jgi:RHS repeat-associated protein
MVFECTVPSSSKTYSDGTPMVTYTYDDPGIANSKGHLTKVFSSSSTWQILAFDVLGRPTSSNQATGTVNPGNFSYTYNLADKLTSETYPSGRQVQYAFDLAGRVEGAASLSGTQYAGGCSNALTNTCANPISYASHGAMQQVNLGNNLVEQTCFNTRLQPLTIRLGSAATTGCPTNSGDTLDLTFTYPASNNGNMLSQSIAGNGIPSLTQNYTYDSLNRIGTFTEASGSQPPNQTYNYDVWGNRWVTGSSWIPYSGQTPTSNTFSNNQWNGAVHDPSGNQTSITGLARSFTYNAENRQGSATINTTLTNYLYDGDGRRVQKSVGGVITTFVYDAMGQLAAEYGGPAPTVSGTIYLTSDHLGSTRVVTAVGPSVVERCDYAPFGEELGVGLDGRTAAEKYCNNGYPTTTLDASELKFTSQERDAETGLDYFGARYMSSAQGRFTSPDEPWVDQDPRNPQSWNLYAYGRNNPLRFSDSDGRKCVTATVGGHEQQADDGTGGGCDAAQVDKKGQAAPQQFNVNDRGQMFTEDGGTTFQVFDNGRRSPVSARSMTDETINLALNFSMLGNGLKLGVVLGAGGKDAAIAALNAMRGGILYGSTFDKLINGGIQMFRSGGSAQAAADFEAVVSASGAQVRTYGAFRSATLADGSEITLRESTTKGFQGIPTLQFRDQVAKFDVKIRY